MTLSTRAQKALDILKNDGFMVKRLERDSYTGREEFKTRFLDNKMKVIKGLGIKTSFELEDNGIFLSIWSSTSVSTYYKIAV